MGLLEATLVLAVVLLSLRVGLVATAPVRDEGDSPAASLQDVERDRLSSALEVGAGDPTPSAVPSRECKCCETRLRELMEELIQQARLVYDDEDQTPTRTK